MDSAEERTLLPFLTYEDAERASESIGTSMAEVLEVGMLLLEWMQSEPHLPVLRENFYRCCTFVGGIAFRKKMSIERAKKFIDLYYTMKTLAPEYLLDRDPIITQLRESLEHYAVVPMPVLTDRLTRVYVIKILDKTFSPHMMTDWNKHTMMVADVQMWEDRCFGEEVVIDLEQFTLQHVAALTPSVIKKLMVCYLKGFSFKPSSIHVVNGPPFSEVVVTLAKSFMKPKIANRFFVHSKSGYETLHEHISPKYLPSDLGGQGPALKDLHGAWLRKLDSYRDWFLEQDNYVVQENLRPGKPVSHSDIFGMEGSFRQLAVD